MLARPKESDPKKKIGAIIIEILNKKGLKIKKSTGPRVSRGGRAGVWYRGGRINDGVSSSARLLRRTWSHEQGEGKIN